MLAAWYDIRAKDPYDGEGPDGISGVHSEPENQQLYDEHLKLFETLNNFFHTGAIHTPAGKPTLYCSDEWAVLQDPETDQLRGDDGDYMFKPDDSKYLMKDDPNLKEELYNADGTRNDDSVYWVPDHTNYFIYRPGEKVNCEGMTSGYTSEAIGTVTICPITFNPPRTVIPNGGFPTVDSVKTLTLSPIV
ncbi:hypothetical protein Dda_9054 [Drechslerella dactyloides]|uniref:Uncharacterized protein n=1 Tax=Drechslerella dactyloides TaxID=74499 RepID=A0AAD6IQX9_DREDA|nr:hypothetical protein Dda_9054 [Drechslerella dactyloides]